AAAAVVGPGLADGEHLTALCEPARNLVAQHRFAVGRAEPLAMDDAYAAAFAPPAFGKKPDECLARFLHAQAVQVELVDHGPVAAAQLARHVGADPFPVEGKAFVHVEVAADIDLVGERFGECGRLVDLALARQRFDMRGRAHQPVWLHQGAYAFLGHLRAEEPRFALLFAAVTGDARGLGLFTAPALGEFALQLAELGWRLERAKTPAHRL